MKEVKMDLNSLRRQIDDIDSKLVKLLNERASKVLEVARVKKRDKVDYYSPGRERSLMERLIKENKGPLSRETLSEIIQLILRTSLSLEKKLRVVYLGPPATFTHLAAIEHFSKKTDLVPVKSIREVFAVVEKKQADFGVVPVENSTEGVVNYTLDMFLDSDLKICAEMILEISHYLLSKGSLKEIKKVYSHPQSFAQCRNWLEENLPQVRLLEVQSNAKAAQLAAKEAETGAIASEAAASLYGLKIIAPHIEDISRNYTKFLIIGRGYSERSGQDKTSILFSIKDRVGALYDMLSPFRKYKINLTKIESRPTRKKAWEYVFFLDFLGHKDDENVREALAELEEKCFFLKILGSYPRGK